MSEPLPSWRARQGVYLLVGHGSLLTPVDSLARLSLAEVPDRVLVRLAPFVVETQAVRSVVRRARGQLRAGGEWVGPPGARTPAPALLPWSSSHVLVLKNEAIEAVGPLLGVRPAARGRRRAHPPPRALRSGRARRG